VAGGRRASGTVGGGDRGEERLVAPVVDEDDRQSGGVQFGDVVEGSLGLDHQQAVEGLRRDLLGEPAQRLLTPVAGEEQQAEALRLDDVDHTLEDLAYPRPGHRGDEHPDDLGPAPGEPDRAGAGDVPELLDDLADPGGGGRVQFALAVEDPRDGCLAHPGMSGHIRDGDRHVRLRRSASLGLMCGAGAWSGAVQRC